jgi:hypothetical protein
MLMSKLVVLILLVLAVFAANDCPLDRETKCTDDFRQALPYCKKAAEGSGKDITADINCLKYFHTTEQ